MKNICTIFLIIFSTFVFSQKTEKLPLRKYKIAILSDSLRETSGLTFLKEKLYTINDGGNSPEIFEIDKNSGKTLKKFTTDFPNKDWEAITNDGENLYVGDFGNNAGNRKDLVIYKTNPICSPNAETVSCNASKFKFNYQEQKEFNINYLNHDFDAEAMIFLDGKLHVFTKEWTSKNISHYILNLQNSDNQFIEKSENLNIGFVVTDASYFENRLYVVGYTRKAKVYLMVFEKDEKGNFFSKILKKYRLGSAFTVGQVEGIAVNQDGIYISNESFSKFIFKARPSLYFIPFRKLFP